MAKTQTPVVTPSLPWRVQYNGTSTATLTPASAIKFASSLLKQGNQVNIQHWVDGEWQDAAAEQQKATGKVQGFNPQAISAMTQFDELTHFVLKNAPKKNGLENGMVTDWMTQFYVTVGAMRVRRDVLHQMVDALVPEIEEQPQE